MAHDKKDLSLSDFDLNLDLEIEKDRTTRRRVDTSAASKRLGNTLDFYNDEMSRTEVEKLVREHESITAMEDFDANKDETDKPNDGIDYAYILNLLNENKKTEGSPISKDDTAKIIMRKTKYSRAYKATRLVLVVAVVVFLVTASFLVDRLSKATAKITELEASMATLEAKANDYEVLSMEFDGQKDEIAQLTKDKGYLENMISTLTGGEPIRTDGTPTTPTTPATSEAQSDQQDGPTKYIVKSGDSYWKISMEFYNNGSYYKDILAANNIKNELDGPHPGQELIIPKK